MNFPPVLRAVLVLTGAFGLTLVRAEPVEDDGKWWAVQPVVQPAIPKIPGGDQITHNPIDSFIRAGLAAKNLTPAPEADRRTLIRRLSFDLLGLPPAPEEVAAFVADPRPDAYELLAARLQLSAPEMTDLRGESETVRTLYRLHLLGLDHEKLTFYHNGIRRRLTDVHGELISQLLA
jgi:hypothetical protein